jgi:hypothetical protein
LQKEIAPPGILPSGAFCILAAPPHPQNLSLPMNTFVQKCSLPMNDFAEKCSLPMNTFLVERLEN